MQTKARRRFLRSEKGVAAIEFAFIFPIFALAIVGVSDLVAAVKLDRDLKRMSASIAHLATRTGYIGFSEKYDINASIVDVFGSSWEEKYEFAVQGVTNRDGKLEVDWTWEAFGKVALPNPEDYFAGSLPENRGGVLVQIQTQYSSFFNTGGFGNYTLTGTHAATSASASRITLSVGNSF